MANKDVRVAIAAAGLKNWEVAYRYGVNDGNFSRLLRVELSEENKARIMTIIQELSGERVAR